MAGKRVSSDVETLLGRHSALFLDKAEDDGVFPRILPGISDEMLYKTFNSFYASNVVFDMTRQWIAHDGPFVYDYQGLSSTGTPAEFKSFADRNFKQVYGFHPDSFEFIQGDL